MCVGVESGPLVSVVSAGPDRLEAVTHAGRLPETGFDALKYCLDHEPEGQWWSIHSTVIKALASTDRPADALTLLLERSNQHRPGVFTAALTAAQSVPQRQLATVLTEAVSAAENANGRIMVLRLAAALSLPDTHDLLERAWTKHGPHRVAVVSAARSLLHQSQSWPILEAAAHGTPREAKAVLKLKPFACAPRHRSRYRELIARICDHPDPKVATTARAALSGWEHWTTEQ
jgi:hypothetical protein